MTDEPEPRGPGGTLDVARGRPPAELAPRVVVARAYDEHGEVALARRGEVVELVVNGAFSMDTVHTATERALATLALARIPGDGLRVLVGGLGLGFTVRALLDEPRVAHVDVVELHAPLVAWARDGLVPPLAGLLDDRRVTVTTADVLDAVPALAMGSVDGVLLDVDNGPGFLIHPHNEAVYASDFLEAAARALSRRGVVAIWSADPSSELEDELATACGAVETVTLDVARDGREFSYTVYLAGRAAPASRSRDHLRAPSRAATGANPAR
jgi:spermidine synthase